MRTRSSNKRRGASAKSSVEASASSDDVREQILRFIGDYVESNGFPPSVREIGDEFNRAPSSVMVYLDRLESEGHLTRVPGIARSLRLRPGR